MNVPLFILDLFLLPVTIFRIILIFFFGSRYGINHLEFIDVIMHASNKYFNQLEDDKNSIDTISEDVRLTVKRIGKENLTSAPKLEPLLQATPLPPVVQNTSIEQPITDSPKEQDTLISEPVKEHQIEQQKITVESKQPTENVAIDTTPNFTDPNTDLVDKNKLLTLLDRLAKTTAPKQNTEKLRSDIDKLNLKLKEVDKIMDNVSDLSETSD